MRRSFLTLLFAASALAPNLACAQQGFHRGPFGLLSPRDTTDTTVHPEVKLDSISVDLPTVHILHFKGRADSLSWERAKAAAESADGYRLVVSLQDRRIWVMADQDTILSAPVAVAKGTTLEYQGRSWKFETPRGRRTVRMKEADPIWIPPDWLYAEVAEEHSLKLGRIPDRGVKLSDGRTLKVKDDEVGVFSADSGFVPLMLDEHIIFDSTLFIPPQGTKNRRVNGALGKFRLDLGEGYLLHGTPYKDSIGMAATHGCIRLRDDDIAWLYDHVPVGTHVYIY